MNTEKHILVVENEHPYLHALVLKLEKAGYIVRGVDNGREALQIVTNETFDILMLDIVMPDTNGFQILSELKAREIHVPTIVLSNLCQEEDKQKVASYGVLAFLEKADVTIAEVIEKVQQHTS